MKRLTLLLFFAVFCIVAVAETNSRSYPAPVPNAPSTRDSDNIKGPVKSYFSQSETFPFYLASHEYSPDGKLISSSAGRTSMHGESLYWYDDKGYLIKVQETEWGNGMEEPYDPVQYSYEFDSLGYPTMVNELSPSGEIINTETYTYSDTTYTVESIRDPNDYFPGYSYNSIYNSQGKIVSQINTNLTDGTIQKSEYAYIPDQNITIEYSEWENGLYGKKTVIQRNSHGSELESTVYNGKGKILTKQTWTYDAYNNVLVTSWTDSVENTTTRTTSKYTYDNYGNPITQIVHTDGEDDESSHINYNYY